MQEPARRGIHGAESPDWPLPDSLSPGAQQQDRPPPDTLSPDAQQQDWPPPDTRSRDIQRPDWPLAGSRPPPIQPPDWPPPETPRPEDEPTVPIEGLPFAGPGLPGPGTDEPTLELPIIGPADAGPAAPGRRWLIGAGVIAALLLLAGGGAVALGHTNQQSAGYREPAGYRDGAAAVPSAVPVDRAHTAKAPLDGRTEAGFDLVDGVAAVSLRTADLAGDLYRISTPSVTPRVSDENGRIRLFLDGAGSPAPAVEIALSAKVRWNLRVGGGTELSTIDLSRARLGAIDLAGGASQINLTLPRPDGTLTVRMSGGVNQFDVHTAGVPVRVRLGSGAGRVVLDGTSHSGVAAGALFTPERWNETVDRIDVDAIAGMSALTVGP
jgi:hypothetical protein